MAARAIVLNYETVRRWTLKFGRQYANDLRRRRSQPVDTWHVDEVFLTINGKMAGACPAVDQHGTVLDILVQSRRNNAAAGAPWADTAGECQVSAHLARIGC